MILPHYEIMRLIEAGYIENALPEHVNGTSLDVTLGDEILVEDYAATPAKRYVRLSQREALSVCRMKIPKSGHHMRPGAFILACTQQVFNLPADISAEYKLKSSLARIGLDHMLAGWCDPGWCGSTLTLELKNETQWHTLIIETGVRIGQVVFHRHEPVSPAFNYAFRGRYNGDKTVEGAKK